MNEEQGDMIQHEWLEKRPKYFRRAQECAREYGFTQNPTAVKCVRPDGSVVNGIAFFPGEDAEFNGLCHAVIGTENTQLPCFVNQGTNVVLGNSGIIYTVEYGEEIM